MQLAHGQNEGAHELGATRSAHALVGPVGFMSDVDVQLQSVHVIAYADDFDVDVGLEVPAVFFIADEGLHFLAQGLHVGQGGAEVDAHGELLVHGVGAGEVVDPEGVEDGVGDLRDAVVCYASEDGEEEGDALDHERPVVDVYTITDVERMFDEEENARAQNLLRGG